MIEGLRNQSFDAVLVRFTEDARPYLYEAPNYSRIKVGSEVMVEVIDPDGETSDDVVLTKGVVVGCLAMSTKYDKAEIEMLITACGASLPLKRVRKIIEVSDVMYEDEKE